MIVPKHVAVSLALYSGLAVILQNGTNASLNLQGVPNPFATAGVSYFVGFLAISVISIIDRPPQFFSASAENPVTIRTAPWYAYLGGPLGAVYVTCAVLLAPRLGFATFQLAVIFGQLTSSMTCDAIGFLHLKKTPTTPWRVSCLLLLALGTFLSANFDSSGDTDDENAVSWYILPLLGLGAVMAGCVFPIQSCVNFEMIQHVGTPFRAVVVNFAGGAASVWLLAGLSYLFSETTRAQGPVFSHAEGIPLWMWLGGGTLGATFITSAVIGLPSLGAVAFTGIFISTQLLVATTFDALGAFGFDPVPLGGRRVAGVLCAVVAAAAFQHSPPDSMSWLNHWPWKAEEVGTAEEKTSLVEEEKADEELGLSEMALILGSIRDSHFV